MSTDTIRPINERISEYNNRIIFLRRSDFKNESTHTLSTMYDEICALLDKHKAPDLPEYKEVKVILKNAGYKKQHPLRLKIKNYIKNSFTGYPCSRLRYLIKLELESRKKLSSIVLLNCFINGIKD